MYRSNSKFKPRILAYDFGWALDCLKVRGRIDHFEWSTDSRLLPEAHVVLFHIPTSRNVTKIKKYPGQIWVGMSLESDVNYPCMSNPEFMRSFDLTVTYRLDSDIPWTYLGPWDTQALLTAPSPKTADAPTVYFASSRFNRSGRAQYVQRLMEHLKVDSYGQRLNNRKLQEDLGVKTKLDTIARYKFTLAFENSVSPDYVTEKFFQPLMAGSVPVYLGAPNIETFAPGERCFIDTSHYRSPRELADHLLRLDRNEAEYETFLRWKTQPLRPSFLDMKRRFSGDPLDRLSAAFQCAP